MRRKLGIAIAVIILLAILTSVGSAIAAIPPGTPSDFTLTDMGANSINITWAMGSSSNFTMIRVDRGNYPTTPTEGALVYYGDNVTTTVSGYPLSLTTHFFSVWGYLADNVTHSVEYARASIGGESIIPLALLFLPLGLTIAMFYTKQAMLGFPCALFWAIFGGYCYTQSTVPWGDWQYHLFFASAFGMTIFTALAAFGLREKRDTLADKEMEKGEEDEY